MDSAIAKVAFKIGDTEYRREYIASYPDNIIALRLSASKKAAISGQLGLQLLRNADITTSAEYLSKAKPYSIFMEKEE